MASDEHGQVGAINQRATDITFLKSAITESHMQKQFVANARPLAHDLAAPVVEDIHNRKVFDASVVQILLALLESAEMKPPKIEMYGVEVRPDQKTTRFFFDVTNR